MKFLVAWGSPANIGHNLTHLLFNAEKSLPLLWQMQSPIGKNELRWQARLEIDTLTGEPNIQYLHSRLHEIICEAETRGRQLALLSIAPDASSEIKDISQEEVILQLSNSLKQFATGNDILVRHEGPRFLLLLQDSSQEYAEAVAERILNVVDHTPFYFGGRESSKSRFQ